MSDPIATPEAPAAPIVATPEAAAPVAATVVTPEPVTLSADDRLSLDPSQRKGLLFGKQGAEPAAEAPAEPAAVEPVAAIEPVVPVAPVEPVAPAVVPVDDELAEPGITKNFRLHTEDPKQSAFLKAYKAALAVNPNVNPADIARSVGLDASPIAAETPTEIPGIVAADQPPAEITQARAEIAAMEAQIDEAVANGELLTPEIAKLQRDYARKSAELSKLELRHEWAAERQAEVAQSQATTTRQQEMQAIETENPALADPESDLSLELDRQFGFITSNPNHPDFNKVNATGFPAYLTEQATAAVVARTLKKNPGMTEAQALAAAKGKATVAPVSPVVVTPAKQTQTHPVPRTVLVTAPGGQQAPTAVPLNIEQIREQAARDPNFRKRALGFSDNRVVA